MVNLSKANYRGKGKHLCFAVLSIETNIGGKVVMTKGSVNEGGLPNFPSLKNTSSFAF